MANPPTQADPNANSAGNPIDLLSDLEERLGALRNWQNQSEAQAEQVRQQSHQLDDRKRELEELQDSIDAAQRELDQNRQALDADRAETHRQREELDQQRASLEGQQRQLDDRRAELDERLNEVEVEAQRQRDAIADEEKQRLDAVAEKERQAGEAQASVEEARERIESREHRLDEAYAKLREEESFLLNQQEEHQAKVAEVEAKAASFDQRESELNQIAEKIEGQQSALDQRTAEIDGKAQELRDLSAKLETEIADLEARQKGLDQVAAELETQKEDVKQARTELHRVQLDQQLRAEALLAQEEALAKSRAELIEQASSGTFAPESGQTASAPGVDAAELERVRQEVDAAKAELTEAREKVEEREREVRDLKQQLEDRAAEVELLEEEIAKPNADADAGVSDSVAASVEAAELQARISAHEDEIADLNQQLDERAGEVAAAQARIAELEAAVVAGADGNADDQVVAKLKSTQQELDDARDEIEARVAEVDLLRQRVEELSSRDTSDAASEGVGDDDFERRRAELDEQASQIAADRRRILERKAQLKQADGLIKARRDKIRHYIRQVKQREVKLAADAEGSATLSPSDRAKLAGMEKQRVALAEVKQFLEQSEAAMVQRWATQKTSSVVTTIVIALILAVAGSFFAAGELTQPVYRATMAVEVTPTDNTADLPPNAWLTSYKQTLLSTPVLEEAINELDKRKLRIAGTPDELAEHLKLTLSVEGKPSRVELAYHGQDPQRIGAVLEAYGRGLIIWHMADDRRAGRLNDTAVELQPAAVVPEPVQDERLNYALAIFAGVVGFVALIALPLRLIFGRSRRVLDPRNMPELAVLETEADTTLTQDDGMDNNDEVHGITNDGPSTRFGRLPEHLEDGADNEDPDEKIFRF